MLVFSCYVCSAPVLQPHRTGNKILLVAICMQVKRLKMASLSLRGGAVHVRDY